MFAGFLGWAGGAWNWFINSPVAKAGAFVIGLIFAWSVAVKTLKAEGAREQKRIHEAANERERAQMAETKAEILDDITTDVEGARDAVARMPQFTSADELRRHNPELAALIFGDPARHGR